MQRNYRSNSDISKEKEINDPPVRKPLDKVVTGKVTSKKPGIFKRVLNSFMPDDIDQAIDYVVSDVLIRGAKDIILDSVEAMLGVSGSRSRSKTNGSKVSYRSYYENENRREVNSSNRLWKDYNDIVFDNRGDAELTLDKLEEILSVYHIVSVADYYDIVGVSSNYTDNNYGWDNLRSASVARDMGGGYRLRLPKALPLN